MDNLIRLNLGCGQMRLKGFVGVDNNPNATAADIVHDLNCFSYPFADSSVEEVLMEHILEHLENPIKVLIELYRVCADGAKITIKSPHFSCNWLHPGHRSSISTMLFDYFNQSTSDFYGNCCFRVDSIGLRWLKPKGPHGWLANVIGRLIDVFANLHVGFCQRVWCYWVGGFEEIEFKVTVLKPAPAKT
jgi:hypothetical protein